MFSIAIHNDVYFQHLPNVYDYVFNINIKIIINLKCRSRKTEGFCLPRAVLHLHFCNASQGNFQLLHVLSHQWLADLHIFLKAIHMQPSSDFSLSFRTWKGLDLKRIIVWLKVIFHGVIKSLNIKPTVFWLHRTDPLNKFPKICLIFFYKLFKNCQ